MKAGQLPARAKNVDMEFESFQRSENTLKFQKALGEYMDVPIEFWELLSDCKPQSQSIDWASGDFSCEHVLWSKNGKVPEHAVHCVVMGLEIDASHLPRGISAVEAFQVPGSNQLPEKIRHGGRRPANWWPDFAEELAVYIHECGLPDGIGHDGQSAVIDSIFARMAERGKSEPGRGTVQPVVNAILRRIRSAGN